MCNKNNSPLELCKITNQFDDYFLTKNSEKTNKLADKNLIYLLGNKNHARQVLGQYGTNNQFYAMIKKLIKVEPNHLKNNYDFD